MVDDLTEKAQASQGKLEQLLNKIPGYGGYRQKELRRDADKLLRMHVARQYEEQLKRIHEVQRTLTETGKIALITTVERAATKLQTLIDRIKNASYGYAGLFDAIKVDDAKLDRLYDFDRAMLDGVSTLAGLIDKIANTVETEGDIKADAKALTSGVEALNTTYSQRQDVILQ